MMGLDEGSQRRYRVVEYRWLASGRMSDAMRFRFWWLFHNVFAHPLLGLFPRPMFVRLHDWTSGRLHMSTLVESFPPNVKNRRAWLHHNLVHHIMIGIAPSERTFRRHDESARQMDVRGWV